MNSSVHGLIHQNWAQAHYTPLRLGVAECAEFHNWRIKRSPWPRKIAFHVAMAMIPIVVFTLLLWERAVDTILKTASTGKIGDGKIFLSKIDEAIRIRNQERA